MERITFVPNLVIIPGDVFGKPGNSRIVTAPVFVEEHQLICNYPVHLKEIKVNPAQWLIYNEVKQNYEKDRVNGFFFTVLDKSYQFNSNTFFEHDWSRKKIHSIVDQGNSI
jgi:hypothetical protein